MATAPDYVAMLREQNRLIAHMVNTDRGIKTADREYRAVSIQLLKQLLGRAPTTEEIGQVCNW